MSHKNKIMALGAAMAALGLAACETPANGASGEVEGAARFADDPRLGERVDRLCFARNIDGFGQTTDRTIIVNVGVDEHYLIETRGYCHDLDWAQSIRFDAFSSCVTRGDSLIPYDSIFGPDYTDLPAPSECRINAIYEWDPDAGEAEG